MQPYGVDVHIANLARTFTPFILVLLMALLKRRIPLDQA